VALTDGTKDVFLASRDGKAIRFNEEDARPMGRVTRGVRGMMLSAKDQVIGMEIVDNAAVGSTIFTVCENGFGKRTDLDEYRDQSRGGKGIITIKTTERNGCIVAVKEVVDGDELMIMTRSGQLIRMPVKGIGVMGRNTQGVTLVNLTPAEGELLPDVVAGVTRVVSEDDEDDTGGGAEAEAGPAAENGK
jgi:DNA gyrase subunit A